MVGVAVSDDPFRWMLYAAAACYAVAAVCFALAVFT
jgi:hypothetical protein